MVVMSHTDEPGPFIVRAEVSAENASIRVSWEWSCRGVPVSINHIKVNYQPEGGSLMMQTVNNTAATSATLGNLQCNTRYIIRIHAIGRVNDTMSDPGIVSLPARGMYMLQSMHFIKFTVVCNTALLQPLPLPLKSLLGS